MSGSVSVACVGCGYFGGFHLDGWARIPRARLVGVCDSDIGKARATGLPAHQDLDRMLEEAKPECLDIVLPPSQHADAIRTAIHHAVPMVICQKPFCRDLSEARAVVDEAEAAGLSLVIHENFRFQPWYRKIAQAISAGAIGTPLQATFRLRPGDGQGRDAYLDRQPYFREMERFLVHETAVHWIDTFRFLFGEPRSVYADLRRLNPHIAGEDAGHIVFDHGNGLRAVFDGNRLLDHAADNLRRTMGEALIEGTAGVLSLTGDGAVHRRAFGSQSQTCLLPPDGFDGFGGDCVRRLQAHVVAAMLDGRDLENTGRDYLRVLSVEAAIYTSARTGARVPLDGGS